MASEEFLPHDGTPVSKLLPPRLTKRELFAAMAMQGMMSNSELMNKEYEEFAEFSVRQADALLARLEGEDAGD